METRFSLSRKFRINIVVLSSKSVKKKHDFQGIKIRHFESEGISEFYVRQIIIIVFIALKK